MIAPFDYIAAGGGLEAIFWLVLAVFWVIAQIAGQAGKKKRKTAPKQPAREQGSEPPPRPRPEKKPKPAPNQLEENLRDFLESLTGVSPEVEEEPVREEARPVDVRPGKPPPIPRPTPKPEPVSDLMEVEEAFLRPADAIREAQEHAYDYKEIAEIGDQAVDISHKLINPSSFSVGLSSLKMPIMNVPLSASQNAGGRASKPDLKDPKKIREAIVNRILLGPPVGLPDEVGQNLDPWRQ